MKKTNWIEFAFLAGLMVLSACVRDSSKPKTQVRKTNYFSNATFGVKITDGGRCEFKGSIFLKKKMKSNTEMLFDQFEVEKLDCLPLMQQVRELFDQGIHTKDDVTVEYIGISVIEDVQEESVEPQVQACHICIDWDDVVPPFVEL